MDHVVLELGLVVALVALAGLISTKLRFSVIPFYILIGMAVGPRAPKFGEFDFRFIESAPLIELLSRLGVGLTIVSRGEFSIILANIGKAGGLLELLQPFAALYVLILAILGPFLTKESKYVYMFLNSIFKWDRKKDKVKPKPSTE
ncbi:hypothetical protein [Paenibacillus sp. UMB4589-SE434]|uniref:hypothetical protein n=1 Tax=Paenibacillus sp. UMB4589-SE434 TaxID=3046314 RepID=UPI00254C64AC|nr:hypothetical protein [Paenibacillus sp. UMB4589-SE434]MDK8181429.1 hypothetical protein [Paenibacillus sp. UMB4589-SE434]